MLGKAVYFGRGVIQCRENRALVPAFLMNRSGAALRAAAIVGEMSADRYYEWDSLHGHIEVYNKRGGHLGVLDGVTGQLIGDPVPGRRIDV